MSATDLDTATKPKVKTPSMWKVVLHNDDYTPMDFVIEMLSRVFHKAGEEAVNITMTVHVKGKAPVGTYTKDVAETKVDQAMSMAVSQGHPLLATIEEA
ncbi:MAG: ATP-dependent Clp protease adaptor ClpS [Verrucomicrobiaceae bacterium]|nr:MAG: ATP-dependent Clp protease adaptor ClpS [Verrucomicrobiaceae bacterium]